MTQMTESPYRPPSAAIGAPPAEPAKFLIGQCVKDAWDAMLRNVGPLFGVVAVFVGITVALTFVLTTVIVVAPGATVPLFALMALLYLVFTPMLAWGLIRFSLNAIDGRARVGDLFGIFERLGARLGQTVILWLILLVLSIPGQLPQLLVQRQVPLDMTLFGLAYVWNIVWAVFVTMRLFFAFFFLVDGEMGAIDALRSSWDRTRGNWLRLVGLLFVSVGIMLAGLLALFVGMIPASVVIWLTYPSAFRQMVGRLGPSTAARAA